MEIATQDEVMNRLLNKVRKDFYVPDNLFKEFIKVVVNIAYERKIFKTKYGCSGYILKEIEPKIFEAKRS
jgi:hypothetical protein